MMISTWKNYSFILVFLLGISACSKSEDAVRTNTPEWLVPQEEVLDGGPGKDGIPAIDNPEFVFAHETTYLDYFDLVLGVKIGDDIRAYPHQILDWHEIVNDNPGGHDMAINYCPLTGTGMAWDATLNGSKTSFGVSGLLYNTNLVLYDRITDSYWSQMRNDCINGELIEQKAELLTVFETRWGTWRIMFPDSKVMTTNTGYTKPYGSYPYGDYKTNDDAIYFPVSNLDTRLSSKERVLGVVINGKAKAYRFNHLSLYATNVLQDEFEGVPIVVLGSKSRDFMIAHQSILADGTALTFDVIININNSTSILVDQEGNEWDVFGTCVEGPRTGQQLEAVDNYIGFWFAWGSFYPEIVIYEP